jgi:CubicO group peptidase (beta-lactamase class C family)
VTKSFTAVVAAMLVDDGKLAWDRPVREYLPWFKLYDPVASDTITLRDLLTHRSGLPRHDFIRFAVPLSRQELVRRLRYLEPSQPFRASYQYNNLMYVTAGFLEGEVAGSSWEQLVKDRIFEPLGMRASTISVVDSQKSADFSKPYENGKEVPFYVYQEFGVGPNGAVNSSVEDLLKYLQLQMGDGTFRGRRLISVAGMKEMHRPQMVAANRNYGLGWDVTYHRGHRLIMHGGAINGFRACIGFLPDDHAGAVILANSSEANPEDLFLKIADRLLKLEPQPEMNVLRRSPMPEAVPKSNTRPSHDVGDYAGDYEHPAYGGVHIEPQNGGFKISFPALSFPVTHFHYDVFRSERGMLVQFQMNQAGEIDRVLIPLEPAVRPIEFVKKH